MRYMLGVIALIIVTIFAVILVTRGRGGTPETQQPTRPRVSVAAQAKPGTSVTVITQGRLVGQSERKAIRLKVSEEERRLEILTGYEEAVEQSYVFPNTAAAYESFMIALDRAGFARQNPEVRAQDERGVCPLGKTYIYELKEFSQQLSRLWNTSCGSKGGTLGGNASTIRRLFESQIPEYRKKVKGVRLNTR